MQRLSGNRVASLRGRHQGLRRTTSNGLPKVAGGAVCRVCAAARRSGHWVWPSAAERSREPGNALCPACRRIAEHRPAHELRFLGLPAAAGRELAALVRRVAAAEAQQHPQERLLSLRWRGGALEVATTGVYVARRVLEAVLKARRTHLQVQRERTRTLLRWRTDAGTPD